MSIHSDNSDLATRNKTPKSNDAQTALESTIAHTASNTYTDVNWYAKLHPTGSTAQIESTKDKVQVGGRPLNLSLFFRIWLAVAIIIIVSGLIVFAQLFNYVRPITQQVIEDTLVDTAKLLAVSLQVPIESGLIYDPNYQAVLDSAFRDSELIDIDLIDTNITPQMPPNVPSTQRYADKEGLERLSTWYHQKTHSSFRVYITDTHGKVIYDSRLVNNDEGADYSRWNDVHRTLNGEYGARTTRQHPDDPTTSVMYVAQPIYASNHNINNLTKHNSVNSVNKGDPLSIELLNKPSLNSEQAQNGSSTKIQNYHDKQLIGVVSVGKPTATILPYLNATRQRMLMTSALISLVALVLAGLIAWWIKQSILLVTRYTQSLAQDASKPYFYLGRELNDLSDTIETMKHKLENRAYVTDYVHTLTHELKSPLTAIRASGELLEDTNLDEADRMMLSQTITEQSIKLQALIDRLLLLAKIEQPTFRLDLEPINIKALLESMIRDNESQRLQNQVRLTLQEAQHPDLTQKNKTLNDDQCIVHADRFWLTQALQNLIDNALYFAHTQVVISISVQSNWLDIAFYNDGNPIPNYALTKVFDRYFSLSHNVNSLKNKKGTGLGLTLVKQVIERHAGVIHIQNIMPSHMQANCLEDNNIGNTQQTRNKGVIVSLRLPKLSP